MASTWKKYKKASNQWVLIPQVIHAIKHGHNTVDLLIAYFTSEALQEYCNGRQYPYTMLRILLRELAVRKVITYDVGKRKWKTL
jgi:hypothetical protein